MKNANDISFLTRELGSMLRDILVTVNFLSSNDYLA